MSFIKICWENGCCREDRGEAQFVLPIYIGSGGQNDLQLSADASGVSRQHARLEMGRLGLSILDLNSRNGVWHNGERVAHSQVGAGDSLVIGSYFLQLSTQVRCQKESCHRLVDSRAAMCPWCGQFMVDAKTRNFADWGL